MRRSRRERLKRVEGEKEMHSEQERDRKEGQESTEEKRVMDVFLHSCSIPLFFKLKQLPLCAAARELEVIASSFHRLVWWIPLGSSQPIGS